MFEKGRRGDVPGGGLRVVAPDLPVAAAVEPNPAIVEHVKAHVAKCTVNAEKGQVYSCKDRVTDAFSTFLREKKPEDFAATMIALVRKTDDADVSGAAVALLSEQFDNLGVEGKKKNASPAVAKSAVAMLQENKDNRAARLAASVAQLATIAGASDELGAVVDAHPTKDVRDNAYRNLMVFGRLTTLPKLKEIAEKKPEHAASALDAVARMAPMTDAERAGACPGAKGYLSDKDSAVATEAAENMLFCKGEYIDALLAEAEARLNNKEYKDPFAMVMRSPASGGRGRHQAGGLRGAVRRRLRVPRRPRTTPRSTDRVRGSRSGTSTPAPRRRR